MGNIIINVCASQNMGLFGDASFRPSDGQGWCQANVQSREIEHAAAVWKEDVFVTGVRSYTQYDGASFL